MKNLKLNLLEKEEMNAVRGGEKTNYHCIDCRCGCRRPDGQVYGPVYVNTGESSYQMKFVWVFVDANDKLK